MILATSGIDNTCRLLLVSIPFSEQNLGIPVWNDRSHEFQWTRLRNTILQLDVVIE